MANTLAVEYGVTLAVVSDLHINSTVGLLPPQVRLDDGQTVKQSPFQEKLWRCWLDYWEQVKVEKRSELWTVILGDAVDGNHHGTTQIISTNMTDQHVMAMGVLDPLAAISDRIYILRGTPAHGGKAGQNEEMIGRELRAVQTESGHYSWWTLDLEAEGVNYSLLHHGSLGRLPWTKGNMAKRLAIELELSCYRSGKPLPTFAVRGHRHQFSDSGTDAPIRVLFTPSWQGPTDYTQVVVPGMQPHVGGFIFQNSRGAASFRTVLYNEGVEWMN